MGTATAAQVLTGMTFTNSSGVGLTGTMANNGAWINTPTSGGKITIPAGYHNGNGYVDTSAVWNAAVTAADSRVSTSSASYSAGYNTGKSNITPTLFSKISSSWNSTETIQTIIPAGNYYFIKASFARTDYGTDNYILKETLSHESGKILYASVDTTVTYSVYTQATKASFTLEVVYWN